MHRRSLALVLACLALAIAFADDCQAETGTGTFTVTGTVVGSITLTVKSLDGTASGIGTSAAASSLGTLSATSSLPAGVTRTVGATTTTFGITTRLSVVNRNVAGSSYTLMGRLSSTPNPNVAWKAAGVLITSNAQSTVISSSMPYDNGSSSAGMNVELEIVVTDPFAGAIDNTVTFTAISN